MSKNELTYVFVDRDNLDIFKEDIFQLLCECDTDFTPPLSSRDASIGNWSTDTNEGNSKPLPITYFETLLDSYFIVVRKGTEIIGFTAFKHGILLDNVPSIGKSNYFSTTCIKYAFRGEGIGTKLYEYAEKHLPSKVKLPYITRRTWSTNYNQLRIYEKLGYQLVDTLPNHRGEGIHTLYFAKKLEH